MGSSITTGKLVDFKIEAIETQYEILLVIEDPKAQLLKLIVDDGDDFEMAHSAGMNSFDLEVLNTGES